MLALRPSPPTHTSLPTTTPHLLPTTLHHNGPIPISPRHWHPSTNDDGTRTAYFRGRKLRGRVLPLPAGYRGVVAEKTAKILPKKARQSQAVDMAARLRAMEEARFDEEGDEGLDSTAEEKEEEMEVKVLEEKMAFNEVVVWGHEEVVGADDDFVKGLREWIGFAAAMHHFDAEHDGQTARKTAT